MTVTLNGVVWALAAASSPGFLYVDLTAIKSTYGKPWDEATPAIEPTKSVEMQISHSSVSQGAGG